jgi:hypothetical protein
MSEIEEDAPVSSVFAVSAVSQEERVTMFFKLRQDYLEERKKIISQLYKKTKFMELTNDKKRNELKKKILESESIKNIMEKMQRLKRTRGFKLGNTHNLQDLLASQFKRVEAMKEQIINLKLDLLFNYKTEDETLAEISGKIPDFNRELEIYKKYLSDYETVVGKKEEHVRYIRTRDEIQSVLSNIEKQQELVLKTHDPLKQVEIIRNMLETYQSSLQFDPEYQDATAAVEPGDIEEPVVSKKRETETTKLMKLKYASCSMYKSHPDDDEFYLIQTPYTLSELEITKK